MGLANVLDFMYMHETPFFSALFVN
jgi:hypothetical protein